jgi:hypothetical protein
VIDRQVDHLTRLIDDLLDFSRITRGRLELRRHQVDLVEVIRGAVESSRPTIEPCGHDLTVTLPAEPIILDADGVRLAQVFLNLLTNAAKYTEPGGRIGLTAERQGRDVVVSVQDTGVGIPAEMLPRLFEPFFQGDRSLELIALTGWGQGSWVRSSPGQAGRPRRPDPAAGVAVTQRQGITVGAAEAALVRPGIIRGVVFQIWTFSSTCAMLIPSAEGECHGTHTSALSLLSTRSGRETWQDRHGETALSVPTS